jgi:hypothetical protein
MRNNQNLHASPVNQTGSEGGDVHQKLSGVDFDEGLFKSIGFAVFEQPIKFGCFQRIIRMGGKGVFRAEVAQGSLGGSYGHKKASRGVKHREAILIGFVDDYTLRKSLLLVDLHLLHIASFLSVLRYFIQSCH